MHVGEVRVADDEDFKKLKKLCEENEGWKLEYHKHNTFTWTKHNDLSDFKLVKVRSTFDVAGSVLYDVIHDPHYRKVWDRAMIDAYDICALNPNNDIGYYAIRCPSPLKNRDFVTLRSWLATSTEYYIMNHSVNHIQCPPYKDYIRAISFLTGYVIVPKDKSSCVLTYVSQSDPRGRLPSWVVNKATQILAPKVVSRMKQACKNYVAWKEQNQPLYRPWIYPEQCTLTRLNLLHIKSLQMKDSQEVLDESNLSEVDFLDDDL
ncbi:domain-containing 10-like [Octopus vulgaris]|uniref:START domain-containing protein 10 n=1 Tax=Octopus vulgaris TaxID=6645 RepID=A0AA36BHK5_OCTVU|nr:domain-containing 10-like [Octopus vulgaris]